MTTEAKPRQSVLPTLAGYRSPLFDRRRRRTQERGRQVLGTALRILFGSVWAVDAYLKWQPGFRNNVLGLVQGGSTNQPSWLSPWYQFWGSITNPIPSQLALFTAIVETMIAICLITGLARKPLYILGAFWSFFIWAVPEGFGNIDRSASTDIGPSIIYVLVFLALYAIDSYRGQDALSADRRIGRYWPRWRQIAEPSSKPWISKTA